MSTSLQTHPKVVHISSALKADRWRVIGGLHCLWCIFDEHTEDGFLSGYSLEIIDELIGWTGFSAAVESVEWLFKDEKGVYIPGFTEHNGKSAKRRAEDAKRKKNVRKISAPKADSMKTKSGLDKKRKDISTNNISDNLNVSDTNNIAQKKYKKNIPSELPDWLPEKALEDFRAHRKEIKKPLTAMGETRLIKNLESIFEAGQDPVAAIDQSIERGYVGVFPVKKELINQKSGGKNESRTLSESPHAKHAVEERA